MRLITATALAASTFAFSTAFAEPMSVEDLFKVKTVGSISISPDGAAVAYTLSSPPNILDGEENGTWSSEVRIASASGPDRLYIPKSMGARSLQWLDADTMVFLSKGEDDDTRSVYKLGLGGGAPEKVFSHSEDIDDFVFAEDGNTLFFSADDAGDSTAGKLEKMGFDANIIDEDGTFTRLYRADLTRPGSEAVKFDLPGHVTTFAASADARRLAVALADTPLIGDDIINKAFHIVNGRTGKVENKIATAGKIGNVAFSPDGRRIAFLAGVDRQDPIAHTVAIADARTGEFEFLTGEDEADEVDFAWMNNQNLRVLVHEGTGSTIYTLSTDGEISDRQDHDGFVVNRIDGGGPTFAAAASSPNRPNALYTSMNGTLQKVTSYNSWLDSRDLGEQRVVRWAARDGVEVEGLLITPRGRAPRGGWPAITVVHGGPESHYTNGWVTNYSNPGHIGAGKGYAVFYPNYRGSTGRGQGFAKLDHADPPAAEFNDFIDGLDYLASEGLVNADKVGITGGSYGGYASAWGATALSEHFAAAVIFVALTDLTSFMGTTDIPVEMIDSHFQQYPEDNWDMYREQSPIYHAANSKTPSLILHGEADPRVHPSQSLQLFRYLKRVGQAPVRLVTYPGEGHGNRRVAARYDYALRLYRWMDHFVMNGGSDLPPTDLPEVRALAQ